MRIVIATKNANKIKEIKNKCADLDIEFIPQSDLGDFPDVIEDGASFEENALKKAITIAKGIGLPTLADDSGLVVAALDGRPGIYSARYAGEKASDRENNELLLREMQNIDESLRTAAFVCVIAIAMPDGTYYTATGSCSGVILRAARGANGFGYDPLFSVPDYNKTMAELSIEEKNTISHRAKALDQAREILKKLTFL